MAKEKEKTKETISERERRIKQAEKNRGK